MDYQQFLDSRARRDVPTGIEVDSVCPALKEFQSVITRWALRRGRAAIFAGTGLGKTLMQLSWAREVANSEDACVLVLTPLAVAEQTVSEASKFGISGVSYAPDSRSRRGDIIVTNYERFDKFDVGDFCGIVLDESGIIKSHDGHYNAVLTDACRALRWRLCCSATPAPNDYVELGQHAEFLGVMSAKEMLSMFFVHDGAIRASTDDTVGADGWRLKKHAVHDFWRWVASWAAMVRHPRDIGFDEVGYDLPSLNLHQVTVRDNSPAPRGMLFRVAASTLSERISARRDTAAARVEAARNIVLSEPNEPWLIWCNLNSEADAIERALPLSLQVAGRDVVETKISRLLGFKSGHPLMLVSKPTIAGYGMNWQHCARMVFVGLTDSFEQVYQAIRRCWRFGQDRPVEVYFVASELEEAVVANLRRKERAYEAMMDVMTEHVRDEMREQLIGDRIMGAYEPRQAMRVPEWL